MQNDVVLIRIDQAALLTHGRDAAFMWPPDQVKVKIDPLVRRIANQDVDIVITVDLEVRDLVDLGIDANLR